VSPAYAREVQKSNEFGKGMEGVLTARSKDFLGILNGVDYDQWDPSKDRLIDTKYSSSSEVLSRKRANKKALQKETRLSPDVKGPLVGMVSRLVPQKGFKFVLELLPKLISEKVPFQLVVVGAGQIEIW